jgi:hypothetical protein
MERVNISKLKKYHYNETLTIIITIVVNIEGRVKSICRKNECTTPTNLPWTDRKTKPKELVLKLWNINDGTNDIKWLPSGKPRFKEVKPKKCNYNSRRHKYVGMSRTLAQLYPPRFVPTILLTKV